MALRRVFVESIRGSSAVVTGDRAHHLHRVARLRPGETIEVSDSKQAFLAAVKRSRASEVEFEIRAEIETLQPNCRIAASVAIFKFSRMEWVIEKATELGVSAIVPISAARSDQGLVQGALKRRERWQRIAEEAASQSRRLAPPEVGKPLAFSKALGDLRGGLGLLLHQAAPLFKDVLTEISAGGPPHTATLLIGPEGGWTDEERESARQAGFRAASLGGGVLRTETAAIAALAVLSHWLAE